MSSSAPESVVEEARQHGVELTGTVEEKLTRYLTHLLETNRAFNLTSITDLHEAWTKHVLDSLTLVPDLRSLGGPAAVVDVGSGGGLPAIPLAIALPSHRFTLVEATGKKARFLSEAAAQLGLDNVEVVSDRIETFGQRAGRGRFDAATSRALSRLPVLLELTIPLLRVGGLSLAIKGEQAEREIAESGKALRILNAQVEVVRRTTTGVVVCIRKVSDTPPRYPRRPGEPKRAPL